MTFVTQCENEWSLLQSGDSSSSECPAPAPCTPSWPAGALQLQPRLQPSFYSVQPEQPLAARAGGGTASGPRKREAEVNQVEYIVVASVSERGREGCMCGGSLLSLVISLSFASCLSLPNLLPIINLSDVGLRYRLTK